MKKKTLLAASFLSLALAVPGCCPLHSIDAGAMSGVAIPVLDRYDAYLAADATLSAQEKAVFQRSGDMIRATLKEALNGNTAP